MTLPRDPNVLAQHRDWRVKASEEEIALSLEGNWRTEHLHELARMEKARAIKATAHEIARLVYAMLRDGTEYVEQSITDFENQYRERKIENIRRQARAVGCDLVPV